MVAIALTVIGALLAGPIALTAVGGRHRGYGILRAILAGLVFPVTWTIWYVVDRRHPA